MMQPVDGWDGLPVFVCGAAGERGVLRAGGRGGVEALLLSVVDLPSVKTMAVTYHYPAWTGMKQVSEEQAGDLRAIEGTDAALTVTMSAPLKDGMLVMDDGQTVKLTPELRLKVRTSITRPSPW